MATFANKETMKIGLAYVESIMNEKIDRRWNLNNDTGQLTLYSFKKAIELYEENLRNSSLKELTNQLKYWIQEWNWKFK